MGIVKKPVLKHYWSRNPMIETPFFNNTIPRDRALKILKNLHFADNTQADAGDRLWKVRHTIDTLVDKFKTNYMISRETSTDESLLKFKGRLKFRQYNPQKRARFGIKVYKVCQSTGVAHGYTWNIKVYTGQDKDKDEPASAAVVLDLNRELLNKGYNVYIDNLYSSPDLYVKLHKAKTNVCGTVRTSRKNMPKEFVKPKELKMKKGEIQYRSCAENLLVLIWKDKKYRQLGVISKGRQHE
ncbi:piggyBac transposable element-derived protein 4-like [Lineus longissimus]|uniref:piggyBac transposable element-derived protein 4-like n=1 Tax=Lineus longissimus TaxID=88925 RepID=UPI00315D92D6